MTSEESGLVAVLLVVAFAIFVVMGFLSYHYGYYEGCSCVMDQSCMPKKTQ